MCDYICTLSTLKLINNLTAVGVLDFIWNLRGLFNITQYKFAKTKKIIII